MKQIIPSEQKSSTISHIIVVAAGMGMLALLIYFRQLWGWLQTILGVISPFLLGIALAFLQVPIVHRVEGALKKSASVSECSVVGRKRKDSDYYEAVAFVVMKDSAQNNAHVIEELESLCSEKVPTYMIPAEYLFMKDLPHTPIGKVDFRALEKEAAEMQ